MTAETSSLHPAQVFSLICLPGVSMIVCFNVLSVAVHRSDDCVENVQITADFLLRW